MTSTTTTNDSRPLSQRVVEKVAAATGADPRELGPLYESVDPTSLDRLFSDASPAADRTDGYVAFTMAGCRVMAHADGTIEVTPKARTEKSATGRDRVTSTSRAAGSPD